MENCPVWAIPTRRLDSPELFKNLARVKYHCFEDGISLCGKYPQPTEAEFEIESGEILSRPDIGCAICRERWIKQFGVWI